MQHNSHFVRSYSRKQILIQAVIGASVGVLSQDYVSMVVMMAYCLFHELFSRNLTELADKQLSNFNKFRY